MTARFINEDTPDVPSEDYDSYIEDQIAYFKKLDHRDEGLWEDFRAEFTKWQQEDFNMMSKYTRGILRSYLRDNGVYINRNDAVAEGLTKLLDEREPTEWPPEELAKMITSGKFNSRRNPDLPGSYAYLRKEEERKMPWPSSKMDLQSPDEIPLPQPFLMQQSPNIKFPASRISGDVRNNLNPAPIIPESQQKPSYTQKINAQSGSLQGSSFNIQNLQKSYLKEDRYSGADDVLDKKLRIFYAMCHNANVDPLDYHRAFPIMLTGEDRDYFFNKVSGNRCNFSEMIQDLKSYFETEQRQERKTIEWEDTTLKDYTLRNPGMTILQCFDLMRDQLLRDQAILRPEF